MAIQRSILRKAALVFGLLGITAASMFPVDSQALPLFARQTGQNCVACHAGGQFPELTPYGRSFKMTGYTIGDRVSVPLSVMGLATYTKVRDTSKSDNPAGDFSKNGTALASGGSLFLGGKITNNIGAFVQWTYDNFATGADGSYVGHASMDNVDIRYADRFVDANRDLIIGVSLNNNPSISDPWNTAAAWMQYVPVPSPTSSQFIDGAAPYPGFGSGGNLAGVSLYMYLNKLVYAELGTYQTGNGIFSPMSAGMANVDRTKLQGVNNPYWRLALTHEWGAHNIMVGTSGMVAHLYDDNTNTSDPNSVHRILNTGLDAQYQYILDPHTVTAQVAYMRQRTNYSANTVAANVGAGSPSGFFAADGSTLLADPNDSDTTNTFRGKLTYVYQAKYGGSLAYFNLTGTTNTALQTSGYDATSTIVVDPAVSRVNANLSGNPATRGLTYEAFWMPVQYARVGVQYTAYSKFNGATDNYDGLGRNASDNNSLFFYVWGAY
ncbi:hypothetical protein [Sulfuricella denitrificans]|nr:hypothetical protein [Sulfuricella denitrificans]